MNDEEKLKATTQKLLKILETNKATTKVKASHEANVVIEQWLKDKAKLTAVLTYHVVAGKLNIDQLAEGTLKTVEGEELTITKKDGVTYVDGNPIVVQNVQATNGVIQVIGAVLLPPSMK